MGGKPKLKSSIKAIQEALFSFRPSGPKTLTWVCSQQSKTHSFRDTYNSFNSIYYTSTSSSSSSTSSCFPCLVEADEQEEDPDKTIAAVSTSTSSMTLDDDEDPPPPPPSSAEKRFFFSPCTTKSIMDEAKPAVEGKTKVGVEETEVPEMGFGKDTVLMAMASDDPYEDFKASMEEMVEANGLKEWSCLQELLHCYLRLNDKRMHRDIVLAFVDLFMRKSDKVGIHGGGGDDFKEGLSAFSSQFSLCLDELGGLNGRDV
ncbi:hypothetical protein QJS10_CPA01g00462 [Acorus calamus]|uniref:Transcription repressor n=1 Tax=Acorus calamus TaxID=4465 RepID=A0AAV9FJT5_ACOCL|nr:hypothetical protein QJS10_CPA01g00462 [Acorus calamus]